MNSFARAAQRLDMSSPVVSRLVADLETHLDTRLLNRSTRKLSLTEAGDAYLERCRGILADIDDTEAWIADQSIQLRGTLRFACPTTFGVHVLTPLLAHYMEQFPEIKTDLVLTDRTVDLVAERFDFAVMLENFGVPNGLVARPFVRTQTILCASPAYLARRGAPACPEDVRDHACLNYAHRDIRNVWELYGEDGVQHRIAIDSKLTCNTMDALIHAARAGAGICLALECLVRSDLADGTLVRVLPGHRLMQAGFQLAYPGRKYVPARVRSMVDFLLAHA